MYVADRPGVLATVAAEFAKREVSIARSPRRRASSTRAGAVGARVVVVTHTASDAALSETVDGAGRAGRGAERRRASCDLEGQQRMSATKAAAHHRWPGLDRRLPRLPAGRRRLDPGHAARGRHAAGACDAASEATGCTVHLKVEGANPTGSFKDRGMTMAVTKAVEPGAATRSLRAHRQHVRVGGGVRRARRHHLRCVGAAGQDRDGQARPGRHARREIIQVDGNFDDASSWPARRPPFPDDRLVTRSTRYRIEGQKTARVRDRRRARHAPDVHSLPVGNAGNITAYWRGYTEYHRDGLCDRLPRMLGTQAAGAAPLVLGEPVKEPRPSPRRSASARPRHGVPAVEAQQQSNGRFVAATDEEILAAYHLVARSEGVFVEPASAASIAGLLKSVEDGWVPRGSTVVCTSLERAEGSRHRASGHARRVGHPGGSGGRRRELGLGLAM